VEGTTRDFHVHIPPGYSYGIEVPLVLNLHGRTSNIFEQLELSQLAVKSDDEGFLLVTPQGIGTPPAWMGAVPGEIGLDDQKFIFALLDLLSKDFSIDPDRIYITGMSNGASFANQLGCLFSDKIAAVAPVAGGHVGFSECQADHPVSVIAFHGINDSIIPYEGDDYNPAVREWVEAWAKRNGCQEEPVIDDSEVKVTKETWENCDGNSSVILYSIQDTGHTWPGYEYQAGLGGTTQSINATDLMWEFFQDHPKGD
jgi:polyhydroxybutyrate depolymerase